MCGRYTLHTSAEKLAEAIALALPETYEPDYNIGPGREVLSVSQSERGPQIEMMHWGLRTPQNFHVNARIETADTAPRFRESWQQHRCLLPANGFYEWYADGITKQPYYIYPDDREISFLAGLWYPAPHEEVPDTCIILTSEAIPSLKEVHHRMLVILPWEARESWLNNEMNKAEAINLTQAAPLGWHTVSRRVNRVQNNDSTLIQASSPLRDDQMMLF